MGLKKLENPPVQEDYENPVKMVVYSAHDTTITASLVAMNLLLEKFENPYYASVLLFERFTDGTIEIYFRDGKKKELIALSSEICQKLSCSINELKTAWSSV